MKKEIFKEIIIPEGVEASLERNKISIHGKEGGLERRFNVKNISFKKEGEKIIIGNKKATKKEKKMINTIAAHINNMIKGVQRKFEYKLKICSSHFPITVEVQKEKVTVKNFLGEKIPRVSKLPKDADVEVKGDIIIVKATDKEVAGQTSAELERVTKIRNRDRRVFQDGIFITEKDGVKI
ncbi:50S ribosomal protein L6 [Candidatus Pacearchaeota archaeon]|nr:50S ribosomal protein L6 [Candidatus Pacearchaeota archaeon]